MKKQDISKWFNTALAIFLPLALCIACYMVHYNDNNSIHNNNNKCAYIGGITIGMDSLKAVNLIKCRLSHTLNTNEIPPLTTIGDSTGYYYPSKNEKYFITLDSGKVSSVYFHSDYLTEEEIKVIAKGNRLSKNRLIYYKSETWTSFQDGKGTYIIYKNK